MKHRNDANLSLFIQFTKVSTTKWIKKRRQEYQSVDPEYVTSQINSHILELSLRQICCLIFALTQKSYYALVW